MEELSHGFYAAPMNSNKTIFVLRYSSSFCLTNTDREQHLNEMRANVSVRLLWFKQPNAGVRQVPPEVFASRWPFEGRWNLAQKSYAGKAIVGYK
jgi:hypothetical protein